MIDYDLIPNIETELNDLSYQILQCLCSYKNDNQVFNEDLVLDLSHRNRKHPIYYEEFLPYLAQKFLLNVPILSSKGNIGGCDFKVEGFSYSVGVSALGKLIAETIGILTENPNIDCKLPFPTLLVNGTMFVQNSTTSIPPHNLEDIAKALIALRNNPDISEKALYNIIKGPDFPTGGIIYNDSNLEKFYLTGEGSITIYPRVAETMCNGRTVYTITELPYLMDATDAFDILQEKISDNIYANTDIKNFSNPEKIKIVFTIYDENMKEEIISWINNILKKKYYLNCVVLRNGEIEKTNIKKLLLEYINSYSKIFGNDRFQYKLGNIVDIYGWQRKTKILNYKSQKYDSNKTS